MPGNPKTVNNVPTVSGANCGLQYVLVKLEVGINKYELLLTDVAIILEIN